MNSFKRFFKQLFKFILSLFILLQLGSRFLNENIKESLTNRFLSLTGFIDKEVSTGSSFDMRQSLIERSIELLNESPFIGVGLGSFKTFGNVESFLSHNDYLLILSEQGILGFSLFLLFLGSFIKLAYNNLIKEKMLQTKLYFFRYVAYQSIFYL